MSIPVYSTRFGVWKGQTGLVEVENDTGNLWVIRDVTVYNGNFAEVTTFALSDLNTKTVLWTANVTLAPAGWYYQFQGRLVIPPSSGADHEGFAWLTNGFPVDVYVGGYSLSLP